MNDASPASFLGGTWTQLQEGQFLMNTYLSDKLNQPIAAGLPNITGSFYIGKAGYYGNGSTASPAFSVTRDYNRAGNTAYESSGGGTVVTLDASTYNSIYSDDVSTVQPYSLGVRIWKRTN